MNTTPKHTAVIIDYGLGNLFSIKHACMTTDVAVKISSSRADIEQADMIILPGVGAFGDAMDTLKRLDLVSVIKDQACSGKPLLGICLGMQLLMTESFEFGQHKGLGLIEGEVLSFRNSPALNEDVKIPHVGWSRTFSAYDPQSRSTSGTPEAWQCSPMNGLREGEYFYFVHSYFVQPTDNASALCWTEYGNLTFCSGIQKDNIFAFQFHPECSSHAGLSIYRNFLKSPCYLKSDTISGANNA